MDPKAYTLLTICAVSISGVWESDASVALIFEQISELSVSYCLQSVIWEVQSWYNPWYFTFCNYWWFGFSWFFIFSPFSFPSRFIDKLQQDIPGKGVNQQLQNLCYIYALNLLHKYLGDFLSTGCITPKQASLANDQLRSLYSKVIFQWFIQFILFLSSISD